MEAEVAGTSPSRTDTAFYDGKLAHTEAKPKVKQNSPMADKQLSETPAEAKSPRGDIEAGNDLNYHTTAEDAGDGYFP